MKWIEAASVARLTKEGRVLFRHGKRQIALFSVGGKIYAVDNRCPHEGYPLLQGSVDEDRETLTCQWHNWKFALPSGSCVLGEDHVRSYPTRIDGDGVYVDLFDPPAESYREPILEGVVEAVDDRQYTRLARELSRLVVRGLDPLEALRVAVRHTYARFEYGTTHAFAAAADWVALYERESARERKVLCLTEALDHIAHDALRYPDYPYPQESVPFHGDAFLSAVEREDGLEAAKLARGVSWPELEPWLAKAALAHYNDFGHAAIYVYKTGALVAALGEDLTEELVLPLTRMLCFTTREDLLPDFRGYQGHADAAPPATGTSVESLRAPFGKSTNEALSWVVERLRESTPEVIYSALVEASALNLLRFDERHDRASSHSVSRNVSWLFFTHAITFANSGRALARKYPELWPRVLLQIACFVGRNKRFVQPEADISPWMVNANEAEGFLRTARELVLDHGRRAPIFSAHLVKTLMATEEELPHVSPSCRDALLGAFNRFLHAPVKEKHPLRTARQALALAEAGG